MSISKKDILKQYIPMFRPRRCRPLIVYINTNIKHGKSLTEWFNLIYHLYILIALLKGFRHIQPPAQPMS